LDWSGGLLWFFWCLTDGGVFRCLLRMLSFLYRLILSLVLFRVSIRYDFLGLGRDLFYLLLSFL